MFRTLGDRPSPWELLLPPEVLRLPGELSRVDAFLDDPVFFAPFAPSFPFKSPLRIVALAATSSRSASPPTGRRPCRRS